MGVKYGGLDLARRIDHSALVVLEYDGGKLYHYADKIWGRVNYSQVADEIFELNKTEKFAKIGFDRTGVGDAVSELFKNKDLFEPIITSLPRKIDIINLIVSLSQQKKLEIDLTGELGKEISEQTFDWTDAGNLQYRHPDGRHDDLFWAFGYACYVASPALGYSIVPKMKFSQPTYRTLDREADDLIERMMNTV